MLMTVLKRIEMSREMLVIASHTPHTHFTRTHRHLVDDEILQVQLGPAGILAPVKRCRVKVESAEELASSLKRKK